MDDPRTEAGIKLMQGSTIQAITPPIWLQGIHDSDDQDNQTYIILDGNNARLLSTPYYFIAKRLEASLQACNGATLNALQQYNKGELEGSDLHKLATARIEGLLEENKELRNLLSEMYNIVANHTFLLDMDPKNPATEVLQNVQSVFNQYTKGSNNGS